MKIGKASLDPAGEGVYRIVFDRTNDNCADFGDVIERSRRLEADGRFEDACRLRFEALLALQELIPENEEITLDWDDADSRDALYLASFSALDHFLACEWEIAAAIHELLLELDPEDHLDASRRLAYCYVPLGEQELFEEVVQALSEGSGERCLLELWNGWSRTGSVAPEQKAIFAKNHPDLYGEFTAPAHPVTDEYISAVDGNKLPRNMAARQLWLQTEHVWECFPGFIEALK